MLRMVEPSFVVKGFWLARGWTIMEGGDAMKFFQGCTALITGASAGLGTEFARQLAPVAQSLVLVARRNDRLEALRAELAEKFPRLSVFTYAADLADAGARVAFVKWLREQGIQIDFLVNNAGLGDHGAFETSEWERVSAMLDVNISALTHLTHMLLPSMRGAGRSAILNVSSVASFFPLPNMAVYAATKAYVTSFSEALRMELRDTGVSVTALCPGPVKTEFFSVAVRPGGEDVVSHDESMPIFRVTPAEAVRTALEAVARDRARVVPGSVLAVAVAVAMLVPFFIVRRLIQAGRSRI
jgi:short-subunit dehydrogenase